MSPITRKEVRISSACTAAIDVSKQLKIHKYGHLGYGCEMPHTRLANMPPSHGFDAYCSGIIRQGDQIKEPETTTYTPVRDLDLRAQQ